jgi:hypothetical protein
VRKRGVMIHCTPDNAQGRLMKEHGRSVKNVRTRGCLRQSAPAPYKWARLRWSCHMCK